MKNYFLLMLISLSISTKAQVFGKVYEADGLEEKVSKHKTVAVIPFTYKITMKKMPKGMTQEDIKLQEEKGSLSAQNSFYTYALQKKEKGETLVDIQDLSRTKVLLERANITEKNISNYLPEELAKILGVEGLITGDIIASQPMSEGAAIATTLLVGWGTTNKAKATIKIYDNAGTLLWSYGKEVSGGLGSDENDMIRVLMRKTARRFPYFKE
jgi:hypothetical protein